MEKERYWKKDFEVCIYAQTLLDKVIYLNGVVKVPPVDIVEVKKAIYYARKYHGSQVRQSGEPFYMHPIEVAYMVSDYLFRTDAIVTSILHDILEDTELTYEEVSWAFGAKVANQVMDLTRIKDGGIKISAAEMVEILYKEKKYDVLLIKLFDRLHNMETIGAKSPEKIERIVYESLETFLVMYTTFLNVELEDYMYRLCCNALNIESDVQIKIEYF